MPKEGKRIPREKIALVIFLALMALSVFLLASYFLMGRQLGNTATVVDDVTGNMQDYSIVMFSGTKKPDPGEAIDADDDRQGGDAFSVTLGQNAASAIKTSISQAYEYVGLQPDLWRDHVFVSDVRQDYEMKGASVATIELNDLSKYSSPVLIQTPKRAFGVFSVQKYMSKAKLEKRASNLRKEGADNVICIVRSPSMLASVKGIDAVISLSSISQGSFDSSPTPAMLITAPDMGDVGTLLFSESNVVSYRTVKTL